MSPIVHCVRHAQGVHNLSHANHHLSDPELTPLGEEQARALGARLPTLENIQLVLSSPQRRAIQTALLAFSSHVGDGSLQVVAWPEVQEASDLICDTGRDLPDIQAEFEKLPVDFALVEPGFHIKQGKSHYKKSFLFTEDGRAHSISFSEEAVFKSSASRTWKETGKKWIFKLRDNGVDFVVILTPIY